MSDNHIDMQGMIRLIELLKRESGRQQPSSFLSTHPVFTDRIENSKKQMAKLPATATENKELPKLFHAIYEQW